MENRAVLLLVVAWLLVDGSAGLAFSSKLIHRFSEEAKAQWASRSGNVQGRSWPRRNSLEYFELLLSNDLKRQRLKLGSKYEVLFPSEGSGTLFFGNDFDWLHYTWIDIGTPNVSFLVALDAGSDLLWVPCECIQCAPLSASYYSMLDKDLSEYSPSFSSTSKHLPCSHNLCKLSTNCKGLKEPCPYIAEYETENTSSSGFLVEDKLHLASVSDHATQNHVQASVILGCGRKQSGGYLDGAAPDGVMGLGPGAISVPSLLAKAGLVQNSFSLCFDEDDSGRIFFGDVGLATQQSTPFLPIAGKFDTYFVGLEHYCVGSFCLKLTQFQALVDSGSSFTYLPAKIYEKIVSEFDKQVTATRINQSESTWEYCYNVSSQELHSVPTMRLMFIMNQSFIVNNPFYSFPVNQGFTIFCLTLQRADSDYGVIGRQDMIGEEVHLTPPPNDGSPNPLPTTQQQSIPKTPAVAPALAGRASSNSSVAVHCQIPSRLCLMSSLVVLLFLCAGHLIKSLFDL
ncbi:aspartic proteinase-like protein 1 isoform X2 [Alnus glutinosa]|uniref:aspartic proteinase-like protein 1 isoform X2 n=1 Tax=Alnus glutinosa TaxID=3517 RepID=UPI002D783F67|nr:aspartic proteinase-like protein 1 isoform X2 [Alnus glutinosa]